MAEKKLFGVPFTLMLSDGTILDGQVIILAVSAETAKSRAAEWMKERKPWRENETDKRTATQSSLTDAQELKDFYAYGVGTKPVCWEMVGLIPTQG